MTDVQTYGHSALQALNATFSKEQAETLLALLAAAGGSDGAGTLAVATEATAFSADPAVHAGVHKYVRAGGDITFDVSEGYVSGQVFNIRATAAIELVGDGVALTPNHGGTLEMEEGMAVTVVMTSPTTADIIGQTVPA